jgi:DNA anti-recombination protein RmuC
LEERVEQLEHLATDQGRQIETIAKGLAELTTDVRAIRKDMNEGFAQVNNEIQRINDRLERIDDRIDREFQRIDDRMDREFKRIDDRFNEFQQTQQLILKILNERL